MYVCLCNAFTDGQVRRTAAGGENSAAGVYRSLGAPRCGKCVPMVREIVRGLRETAEDGAHGAPPR